jgi:pimeloyl-ACP methyl ester carboxylesterase
MFITMM